MVTPSQTTTTPGPIPASQATQPGPMAWNLNPSVDLTVYRNGQILAPLSVDQDWSLLPVPGYPGWFNLSIFVPETQDTELFILGVPSTPANIPAPLLTVFHQSNASHGDVIYNTSFLAETQARGWYMVAPLARGPIAPETAAFSHKVSQVNARAAMRWVVDHYPIDSDRIYGVGFSGGGALAVSMASRYLDPREPMFAALVDHTGVVDMADAYQFSDAAGQAFFSLLYGGAPSAVPFEFASASVLQLDANHLWVAGGKHMAANYAYLPVQVFYSLQDPQFHLIQQNSQLFDWLSIHGTGPVQLNTSNYAGHSWAALDEFQVCDWLSGYQLQLPLSGDLLMDRDARFLYFDLVQDAPGTFSKVQFSLTPLSNSLSLLGLSNVQRLTASPSEMGLSTAPGLTLHMQLETSDGGDVVRFRDVLAAPVAVLRDGVANFSWTYVPGSQRLEVLESSLGVHDWTLQF
ncbi:MAG: prolyl oligopeptidase family serine peptidase [Planctomycetes bacterium]|nr:prolyl oligopeptidase family serine peptidase [Planctomycetota bacterium]MCB9909499.1 prolyl oligopeptidase family serine peptidase [Planctomycetota bacterium]MCB9912534.1 prolyl oligopeptidase family serine peptidase [Planctomycetota bacterium]HPF15457.1 prolyl oligopeptidase family serine peptidase [Planctomycetota bacterium]